MKFFNLIFATLFIAQSAFGAVISDDTITLGKSGSTANKSVRFGAGTSATKPQIRYNVGSSLLEFSNNGTDFLGIGSGSGGGSGINLLSEQNFNPDFESGGFANWTASGFTPAVVTTGSNLLFGKASVTMTATAAAQTFRSSLVTMTYGLENKACLASLWIKGGDANWTVKVLDASSNLITSRQIPSAATAATKFDVPFGCGAQGSQYRISLESTAAAALIALDRTHIGELGLSSAVLQSGMVGAIEMPAPGCAWAVTTFNSWQDFPVATCAATTKGSVTYNGNTPSITIPYIPAGDVEIKMTGLYVNSGANGTCTFRVNDGTSASGVNDIGDRVTNNMTNGGPLTGRFSYSTPQTNRTFKMQAFGSASGEVCTFAGRTLSGGMAGEQYISAVYYPPANQTFSQAYSPSTIGWLADANVATTDGTFWDMSSSSVSTNTVIAKAFNVASMVQASTSTIAVGAVCSATAGVPGTMTCPSGQQHLGLVTDVPTAGKVRVCTMIPYGMVTSGAAGLATTFRMAETNALGTTMIQVGNEPSNNYLNTTGAFSTEQPNHFCTIFDLATSGRKYFRPVYASSLTGTVTSRVMADRNTALTLRDFHITVEPYTQNVPAPVFVGPFANNRTVTSTMTTVPSDSVIFADSTTAPFTVNLVSPVTAGAGKTIRIVKTNGAGNMVSITGFIAGATRTVVLHAFQEYNEFISDGTSWNWVSDSERTERIRVANAGSASVTSQSGGWVSSVSRTALGQVSVNFASGVFSSIPSCTCSAELGYRLCSNSGGVSTSSINLTTGRSNDAGDEDRNFALVCRGPR